MNKVNTHTYGAAQRRRKVLTIGGDTDDGACVSTRPGGSGGHASPEKFLKLGECRTLLGEREQAIHSFNLHQRLFSEVSDHSTQVAWHVAEQSLSHYSLQKCLTA